MKADSALSMHTVAAVIVRAARFHLALCLLSGALILISQLCLCILCVLNSRVSGLSVCVVIAAECFCFLTSSTHQPRLAHFQDRHNSSSACFCCSSGSHIVYRTSRSLPRISCSCGKLARCRTSAARRSSSRVVDLDFKVVMTWWNLWRANRRV